MDAEQRVLHRILGFRRIAQPGAADLTEQRQAFAQQILIGAPIPRLGRSHKARPAQITRIAIIRRGGGKARLIHQARYQRIG
jgi:hypothetical protein